MNSITVVVLVVALLAGGVAVFTFVSGPQVEEIEEPATATPEVREVRPVGPENVFEEAPTEATPSPQETLSAPSVPPPIAPTRPAPAPRREAEPPPKQPALPTAPRAAQEFIVKIHSDSRAEPSTLAVRVGDTVTFINEDEKLHWPGADPHPTHSSLPTFDALGGISKGQSFSHTFRVSGTFGYHEHLLDDPPTMGIITVLP